MKKLFVPLLVANTLFTSVIFAQNRLESTGNIGVGTLSPGEKLTIYNGSQLFRKQFGTGIDYDWFSISSHEQVEKPVTGIATAIIGSNVNLQLDDNGQPTTRNVQPTTGYRQAWALTFGSGVQSNNFSIWGGNSATNNTPLSPLINVTNVGRIGIGLPDPGEKLTIYNGNQLFRKQFGTGTDYDWFSISSHEQVEKPITGVATTIIGSNVNSKLDDNGRPTTRNIQPTIGYRQAWALTFGSGAQSNNLSIWGGNSSTNNTPLSPLVNIDNNGNVGIGTPAPQSRLAVNGTVTAIKVKVTQTGWPDFVFRPGYKLLSLAEVEKFIKVNNRLPDIPSEAEIAANGVDVGENQAKLLQKVEELTLYLIELNKKVEVQQQLIVKQERELFELRKQRFDLSDKNRSAEY